MAPKVGITWDAEADRKILLAVLKDSNVTAGVDWDALAAELSTDTTTCTVAALKKHISRIRVASKDNQESGEDSASPAPKTPATKGKGSRTAGSAAGPKVKGKGKSRPKRSAEDDSDEEGTPLTKKVKRAAEGDLAKVKTEKGEDSD